MPQTHVCVYLKKQQDKAPTISRKETSALDITPREEKRDKIFLQPFYSIPFQVLDADHGHHAVLRRKILLCFQEKSNYHTKNRLMFFGTKQLSAHRVLIVFFPSGEFVKSEQKIPVLGNYGPPVKHKRNSPFRFLLRLLSERCFFLNRSFSKPAAAKDIERGIDMMQVLDKAQVDIDHGSLPQLNLREIPCLLYAGFFPFDNLLFRPGSQVSFSLLLLGGFGSSSSPPHFPLFCTHWFPKVNDPTNPHNPFRLPTHCFLPHLNISSC